MNTLPDEPVSFEQRWSRRFATFLPQYPDQAQRFFADRAFGFEHSSQVLQVAQTLARRIQEQEQCALSGEIIEHLAIFHDLGKFFQRLHTLENISLAEAVYGEYAAAAGVSAQVRQAVLDGIEGSDFYNTRLDPAGHPPRTLEGEIVRAADKMQENLVAKVDRYYDYGVKQRGATFFLPTLTPEQRSQFSFANFLGDQLNVILAIIGLRPADFTHPLLQQTYRQWSGPAKQAAVERMLALAREVGEPEEHLAQIQEVIAWYRSAFDC